MRAGTLAWRRGSRAGLACWVRAAGRKGFMSVLVAKGPWRRRSRMGRAEWRRRYEEEEEEAMTLGERDAGGFVRLSDGFLFSFPVSELLI